MQLEKQKDENEWKAVFRKTRPQIKELLRETQIPDSKRRELVLSLFDLNSKTCELKYETLIRIQGEDFFNFTKKAKRASKNLDYDILNEKGMHDLEMILAILIKETGIKHSPMLVTVAHLLLVFMRPAEVYYVLSDMAVKSQEILRSEE